MPSSPASAKALACPQIVVHKTDPLAAPENTLPGIVAAGTTGAGWVEMDVRWSSSHYPILMHDDTVDRTTPGTGTVASLGLGALQALTAADYAPWLTDPDFSGAKAPHVPYAWDFINTARAADLNVLLHIGGSVAPSAEDIDKLAHYIDVFAYADRAIIMAAPAIVAAFRARFPSYRYALIEYNPATTWRKASSVLSFGVTDYVIPERDIPSPGIVAAYHEAGITVWGWSSDSVAIDVPATWARLRAASVDYLITNQPVAARAALCPVAPTSSPSSSSPPHSTPPPTTAPAPSESGGEG